MRAVGWCLLIVGCGIAGLWSLLLLTGQVPEVEAGQRDIWFHITAETGAAVLLIVAGRSVLRGSPRSGLLAAAALGALSYTAVNSAGYYAQSDDWAMVGMFGVIITGSAIAAARVMRSERVPAATPEARGQRALGRRRRSAGTGSPEPPPR